MTTDRIEINPAVMMGKPVIRGTRITIAITIGLFLAQHPLFFQAPLVHLIRYGSVTLVVLIIRRAGIAPPERIVIAAVDPGIAPAPAASKTEAVVAKATVSKVGSMKTVVQEGIVREACMR